jgi:hypothetical protein
MKVPGALSGLSRRKVYQVTIAYAVVAYIGSVMCQKKLMA